MERKLEDIKIEKMVNTGLGLAKVDGKAVFVEDVVTGDIVDVEVISSNKSYEKAIVLSIKTPSPFRTEPFCKMSSVCGGCSWQHIKYAYQLEAKKQIVKECLEKIAGQDVEVFDTIPSPLTQNYRVKVQYPVSQTKVSKRILAGYYKKNTHEIINIKHCPIQPSLIDDITEFLREEAKNLNIPAYNEQKHKGTLRHFVFRYSMSGNKVLLTLVVNDYKLRDIIKKLSFNVSQKFPQIEGVVVNYNTQKTNKIMGNSSKLVVGEDSIIEKIENIRYRISAESFFQVNIPTAKKILQKIKNTILELYPQKDASLLDAYSGVGMFSLYLADSLKKVSSIEECHKAVLDAKRNLKLNKVNNVNLIEGDVKQGFKELLSKKERFDVVIIDPPRKGCEDSVLADIATLSRKHIIYLSCNPSTLARDMKKLVEFGYKLKFVQPYDMFCHTPHVETLVLFEKD